jgi:hypothetical protein
LSEKAYIKCGQPLAGGTTTGRPRIYYSTVCRRVAELEVKRINRCLEALEGRLSERLLQGDMGLKDLAGRSHREQMAALKAEIARQEERPRALLEQG